MTQEMGEQLKRSGFSKKKLNKIYQLQEKSLSLASTLEFNFEGLKNLPRLKNGYFQKNCSHHSV